MSEKEVDKLNELLNILVENPEGCVVIKNTIKISYLKTFDNGVDKPIEKFIIERNKE